MLKNILLTFEEAAPDALCGSAVPKFSGTVGYLSYCCVYMTLFIIAFAL